MSRKRYRHRRKRKKGVAGKIAAIAALLAIAVGALYAYSSMRRSRQATALVPTAEATADLMTVDMPASVPSVMKAYPGFTLSFNPQTHQPNWVAWELTADESRATEYTRKNADFAPDPEVEGCAQLADYKGSGYDRGHMAPAGDMKWSLPAMTSCFFLTNICPQRQVLNSGAWNKLEEKCREWAVRDSAIVIICGPIFPATPETYIGETRIPVPTGFFKVILAPYAYPPRGIGFIMPNDKVPGGIQRAAVSIDRVEALTGYDFFSSLPDDIENEVERECNFPKWSQR